MRSVEDAKVAGQKVIVRVDFNVPLSEGTVTDDNRIRAALPTIEYLLEKGAAIILMSHLGRPSGTGYEADYSLAPAARVLSRYIKQDVQLARDVTGDDAKALAAALQPCQVMMLENLRFDSRETKNDPGFCQELASLADIYVNDAFGTAHRAHASTAGIAQYLPSYAGFLLASEVYTLTNMLSNPSRPFVAILGGSKVSEKIRIIDRLLDLCDALIIGGGMCFTFLAAQGHPVGTSLCEEDWKERALELLAKAERNGVKLLLPLDVVVADSFAEDAKHWVCDISSIPEGMMGLDIGPATGEHYARAIESASTIYWNGPMGVFEWEAFEEGTHRVAEAVARNSTATSIIGGGDSVAAVNKFHIDQLVTFISTGGGASMELIQGDVLPGVAALED